MNTIGIIVPKDKKFNIINRLKPELIFNEKHLICFVVVNENQNYNRIFKKHKVNVAVCADNVSLKRKPEFKLCNGQDFYKKYLMYFIVKAFKIHGLNSESATLAVSFNEYSQELNTVIIQSSKLFRYIIFVTENKKAASEAAQKLMDEYGINIEVLSNNNLTECDMAVELTENRINCKKDAVLINIYSNITVPKEYNITMPKNFPYKVNNIALSEARKFSK